MRVSHQLNGQKVWKDINDSTPLSFFASNKIGGLLYLDASNDKMQYFARIGDQTLKVLNAMNIDKSLTEVENSLHSLRLVRDDHEHEIFIPYFMNALLLKSAQEDPFELEFDPRPLGQKGISSHHVYDKEGRVIIKSSCAQTDIYTVLQGKDMSCDYKKTGKVIRMGVQSEKIALAISHEEKDAITKANHIFENHEKIKKIQEQMLSSTTSDFKELERSMAYSIVLNGTDSMFIQDGKTISPVPFFADVSHPHPAIASHALLMEGEYGMVKDMLLQELRREKQGFHEAAWPVLMLGKMLDRLCSSGNLYDYFSTEEIKKAAIEITRITDRFGSNPGQWKKNLESKSLMLLMYNLALALTKKQKYAEQEEKLKKEVLKDCSALIRSIREEVSREKVKSLFMTAYVYPKLLSEEAWKECFDTILDKLHGNFKTMRSKLSSAPKDGNLELELFGLMSLAAIVLSRVDNLHYFKRIEDITDTAVQEVLYKGVIGRPSLSYSLDVDLENGIFVKNMHMANNSLFLEMLRECA